MLDPSTSLAIFKLVLTSGSAVWALITVINNLQAFLDSSAAIGRTMSMEALDHPPRIVSPLQQRAVHRRLWPTLALLVILTLQVIAAITLVWASLEFTQSLASGASPEGGVALATLGMAALAAAWQLMLCGGLWFAYWIRQESLQQTHLTLLALSAVSVMVLHF